MRMKRVYNENFGEVEHVTHYMVWHNVIWCRCCVMGNG